MEKKYLKYGNQFTLGTPIMGKKDETVNFNPRYRINQLFGENAVDFYKQLGLEGHNGIDYNSSFAPGGEIPVYATHNGWVTSDASIQSDTAGRFVKIMSDEVIINKKPCKVETVLFHLSEARVGIKNTASTWWGNWFATHNNYIKQGQIVGTAGNTGRYTTGPHLHFGMYIYWKQANGNYVKDWGNGYHGAVDPMPYFYDFNVYEYGQSYYFNGKLLPSWDVALNYIKNYNH